MPPATGILLISLLCALQNALGMLNIPRQHSSPSLSSNMWTQSSNAQQLSPKANRTDIGNKGLRLLTDTSRATVEGTLTATSLLQIMDICRKASCEYSRSKGIIFHDTYVGLPLMLNQLKKSRTYLKGYTLTIRGHRGTHPDDSYIERIVKEVEGSRYEWVYTKGERIFFDSNYKKYITGALFKLRLIDMAGLKEITSTFFEDFVPELVALDIQTTSKVKSILQTLNIGFLPQLLNLTITHPVKRRITGCELPYNTSSCFSANMSLHISDHPQQENKLIVEEFHLPKRISEITVSLRSVRLHSDILEKCIADYVHLSVMNTGLIGELSVAGANITSFTLTILDKAYLEDDEVRMKHLDSLLHNPSVAPSWTWESSKAAMPDWFPVVFKSVKRSMLQEIDVNDLNKTCSFTQEVLNQGNKHYAKDKIKVNDTDGHTVFANKFIHRGFYVDISALIDDFADEIGPLDQLEVTAFHAHVSQSRKVNFKIKVSYVKLTVANSAAIFCRHTTEPVKAKRKNMFRLLNKGCSGMEIRVRDEVDAVFLQAVFSCAAMYIASERKLQMLQKLDESIGWALSMYPFPKTCLGTSSECTKAEVLRFHVNYFAEYFEQTSQWKPLRVPDAALRYQEESLDLLLDIAVRAREKEQLSNGAGKTTDNAILLDWLDAEYKRITALISITLHKVHSTQRKLANVEVLLNEANGVYARCYADLAKLNETYRISSSRSKIPNFEDVAMLLAQSVLSIFYGLFDSQRVLRRSAKVKGIGLKYESIQEFLKAISKLSSLYAGLDDTLRYSRESTASFDKRERHLFDVLKEIKTRRLLYLQKFSEKLNIEDGSLKELKLKLIDNIENALRERDRFEQSKELFYGELWCSGLRCVNDVIQGLVEVELSYLWLNDQRYDQSGETSQYVDSANVTLLTEAFNDEQVIDLHNITQLLKDIGMVLKSYDFTFSEKILNEGRRLNVGHVLEWDNVVYRIEEVLDDNVCINMPEVAKYKHFVLRLVHAAELKMQALIDQAAVRLDLEHARFELTMYLNAAKSAVHRKNDMKKSSQSAEVNKVELLTFDEASKEDNYKNAWEIFNSKLTLMTVNLEYCKLYYFLNLQTCSPEYNFDFRTKLDDIVSGMKEFQRKSSSQLQDLKTAPETFQYRTITYMQPEQNCSCLNEKHFSALNTEMYYESLQSCVPRLIKKLNNYDNATKAKLITLLAECHSNEVMSMRQWGRVAIEIPVNSVSAQYNSRVRIDRIEVILHGALTDSGIITVSIETSGLSRDRYNERIYEFYGKKFLRDFSYYSSRNLRNRSVASGKIKDIVVLDAADIHHSYSSIFYGPALFNTWVFNAVPERNPGLSLDQLHTIEVKFSGSFVPVGRKHDRKEG